MLGLKVDIPRAQICLEDVSMQGYELRSEEEIIKGPSLLPHIINTPIMLQAFLNISTFQEKKKKNVYTYLSCFSHSLQTILSRLSNIPVHISGSVTNALTRLPLSTSKPVGRAEKTTKLKL